MTISTEQKTDRKNVADILPLTPVQEAMLAAYLQDPRGMRNVEQLTLDLTGPMDQPRFAAAWRAVTDANQMLRTVYRWENVKAPLQMVLKQHTPDVRFFDLSGGEDSETAGRLETIKNTDRAEAFDLRKVPFRVSVCTLNEAEQRYVMIVTNHHILYDGWSSGIILEEFFTAYRDAARGRTPLIPAKTSFKEYIRWTREPAAEAVAAAETYWRRYLEGFASRADRPVRRRHAAGGAGTLRMTFDAALSRRIEEYAVEHKLPAAALLYAAWGLLLQAYGGGRDVLFDTTVSGRPTAVTGIEKMVGLFINTLPLRVRTEPGDTVTDLPKRIHRALQRQRDMEHISMLTLKELLDDCHNPAPFDSVVVIENYPLDVPAVRDNGVFAIGSVSNRGGVTGYDVTLLITLSGGIDITFVYGRDLLNAEIIETAAAHFAVLTEAVVGRSVSPESLLPGAEVEKVTRYFSDQAAVPDSADSVRADRAGYIAPADAVEKGVAELWTAVLNLQPGAAVGRGDNFFDFGGHSLKASLLAAKIHQTFNVKIPLADIFKYPVLREMAERIRAAADDAYVPLDRAEARPFYPAASAQQRMVALQQLDPESTAYNVTAVLQARPAFIDPDRERLQSVFRTLIRRHEIFRTSFHREEGEAVQRIHDDAPFEIVDSDHGGGEIDDTRIVEKFIRPFDLSQAPLLRVGLVKTGEDRHLLILDMHHIVTDGVTMDIVIKEFTALYNGDALPPVIHPYKDFALWQHRRLTSGALKKQEDYWLNELSGELPVLNLPTDFPRPSIQDFTGDRVSVRLEEALVLSLRRLADARGVTLFMVLSAALNVLLSRWSGQEDIIVGTTTAGRDHADLPAMVGLFIETLALRNRPAGDKDFETFLNEVGEGALAAFENQAYPFRELMKRVGDPSDMARNPLFNVMLILQNVDMAPLAVKGLTVAPVPFFRKVSKVDITVEVFDGEGALQVDFEYRTRLFREETIQRMSGHFINILEQVAHQPTVRLSEIEMLSDAEQRRLLDDFAGDGGDAGEPVRVDRLIDGQAAQNPEGVAVVYDDGRLTYKELDEKARRLSKILEELEL